MGVLTDIEEGLRTGDIEMTMQAVYKLEQQNDVLIKCLANSVSAMDSLRNILYKIFTEDVFNTTISGKPGDEHEHYIYSRNPYDIQHLLNLSKFEIDNIINALKEVNYDRQ